MNDQNEPGDRRLRDVLGLAPDGRRIHRWIGRDRKADVAALADAIAATGEVFNHNGVLARLDGSGKLVGVNLAGLQELVGRSICGMRVVVSNGVGRKEYFTYEFAARPHAGPPRMEDHGKPPEPSRVPDSKVLEEIYRDQLLWRLPRVES